MKNRIYIADTEALNNDTAFARLFNLASPERKLKTDKLVNRKDKILSLAAEALLRKALADIGITDFSVIYGENKKPYLADNAVYFSLSHSAERVICAVSEAKIGADTEKITGIELEIAKRFFHPDEYEMFKKAQTEEEKQDLFFRLWTLKESFTKALELGAFDYSDIDRLLQNNNIDCFKKGEMQKIGDVLLTGAAGFLGIHILYELIHSYDGKIYCMLRDKNGKTAESRLNSVFYYYFEESLKEKYSDRVIILSGDVTDRKSFDKFLQYHIDTVINCAANVKHFSKGRKRFAERRYRYPLADFYEAVIAGISK